MGAIRAGRACGQRTHAQGQGDHDAPGLKLFSCTLAIQFHPLQGYGFVEFLSEDDADYSIKIMNMIKLFGKPVRVNKASAHQKNLDVGANIFIGNLDPEVDEKLLYDTFSAFGVILTTPKIQRDPETGNSKVFSLYIFRVMPFLQGFAFINYASFEAADAAIEAMNGE